MSFYKAFKNTDKDVMKQMSLNKIRQKYVL